MEFRHLHSWNLSVAQATRLQNDLAQRIRLKRYFTQPRFIAGADVAFRGEKAFGVVVVTEYPGFKIVECVSKTEKITRPYVPGLLTFREGPVLEKCFAALENEPDVIIFDGQGVAHPRCMGIAAHMGILLDTPAVGCAKTHLFGTFREPAKNRGAFSFLFDTQGNRVGAAVRTRSNVRTVFVSPGHKIDLASSIKIVLLCSPRYRIPEPIRYAHHLASQFAHE